MSKTVSKLSVELSLDSGNFQKAITNANKAIKNLDKEFKIATKGVDNLESSYVGLGAKIDNINGKIELNEKKLEAQKGAYNKLETTLEKQKEKLIELENTLGKNSDEWKKQNDLVAKNSIKLETLATDISKTKSELESLSSELNETQNSFNKLGQKIETIDDKLDKIEESANLAESEFNKLGATLDGSIKYFSKLGLEVDKLKSQIESGKSKINSYESEIETLEDALEKCKTNHSYLKNEISEVENELEQAKNSFEQNSNEVKELENKLNQLRDSYNQVENEIEQNENALNQYRTSLNNTQSEVTRLTNDLNRLPFDRVGTSLQNTGNAIKGVGQNLLPVTATVTGLGGAALATGLNFETSMSQVQATLGETKEGVEVLKNKALELGSSTSFSSSQVADAFGYMALAGYDAGMMLDSISPLLNLAKAGNIDLALTSDLVTDSMSALGKSTEDLGTYLDMVAMTSTKSNTSVQMLMEAFIVTGGMAQTLGVDTAELSGALGVLANNGKKGSEAGRSLSAILTRLSVQPKPCAEALDALGISVFDADGNFIGLENTLIKMKSAFDGLTQEQKGFYAAQIAGGEYNKEFIQLVSSADGTLQNLSDTINDSTGSLEKMAEIMGDNLQGKIHTMKSAIEGSLYEAFKLLLPTFEKVIDKITDLANWFTNLDDDTQSLIITIAGIAGAIGPILIVLGALTASIGSIISFVGKLSLVFGGLSSATLPLLGAAFVALASVIGDSKGALQLLQDKFGGFGTVVGGVCEFISGAVQMTVNNFLSFIGFAVDAIAAMIDGPGGATIEDAWEKHLKRVEKNNIEGMNKINLVTTKSISQMRHASETELNGVVSSLDVILSQIPKITSKKYKEASESLGRELFTLTDQQRTILQGLNDTTRLIFSDINNNMSLEEATKTIEDNLKNAFDSSLIDTSKMEVELKEAIDSLNNLKNTTDEVTSKEISVNAEVKGKENLEEINKEIIELPDEKYVIVDAEINESTDKVKEVKEELKDLPKEQKVEVKADVNDSKEKVKEVNKELETVGDKESTVIFNAETAQASKNVTGLKKNIYDYDSKNTNKTKKTTFHTETAQASKNVTGLKNNIRDYVNNFAKTFTTTFNVVTNHKTIGTPTSTPKAPKVIPRETLVNSAKNVATPYISPKNSLENNRDVNTINTKESINNVNANSSNLENTLKSSRKNKNNFMDYFYNDISPLQDLEDKLKDINNQLDILDKKSESAFGDSKVNTLKNQVSILEKQKNIQKDLIEEAKVYQNELKYFLGKNNINFDKNGNILGKQEKLLSIEKQINSLRNSSSNAKKDKEKEIIENKISSLEKLKKAIEEYESITNDKIPNATKEWLDLENKIKDTQSAILDAIDAQKNFKANLNIQTLEQDIEDLTNDINLLDNYIERAFGENKVKLIEKKRNALKQEQKELNKLANTYREQAKDIANFLNNQGFVIEKDGDIGNLEHLEKLQSSPIFDNINKKLEEYIDLTNNKIPSLQDDWWNLQSSIESCKDEIKELEEANLKAIESAKNLVDELKNQHLEFNIDEIQDKISRLDREINKTTSLEGKIGLYNEKIRLINKEQEEVKKIISLYEKQSDIHKKLLSSKGFKFDSNGLITNLEHLESLVNDKAFEDIKEALNEYADLTTSTIPNLKDEWEDLENSIADCNDEINKVIKDTLNEKLEITSTIEDKITQKYEKEVQDRIDLINKEKDAEIKALKEKQDAYNNSRNEQKYQDNYDDQLKKVMDIQKQLDILAKDNSLSGQKKYKELLDKLKEEQKALEDLVQDKIDKDVNDMFDKESDRISESAENSIKDLEDRFNDSKIAEMVAEALGSGVFTDIEGNVTSLENALVDFAKESGELFGVLGSTIEKELIDNLQVAVDTFKDLDSILQTLNSNSTKFSIPDVDYSSARYAPSQVRSIKSNTNNTVSVNFNQPLVSINGNVDKEVMPELEKAILNVKSDIINIVASEIVKYI